MARKVLVKLLFVFFVLVIPSHAFSQRSSSKYEKYVDQITSKFIKEMKKKHNLTCAGKGGSMPYNVKEVGVMFILHRDASIDEARAILVDCVEELNLKINESEKIRPFLAEYPFPTKSVEINLSFMDKDGNFFEGSSLAFVSQIGGKIHYRSLNNKTGKFEIIAEEPYEEALKIVRGKESSRLF